MNGNLFKVLRMKEQMTQEEFAKHLGISRSLVAGIEQGRQPISDLVRARLVAKDYRLDDSFYTFLRQYRQMDEESHI